MGMPGVEVIMERCEKADPGISLTSHHTRTCNFNKLSEGFPKNLEHIH